MSDSLHPEGSEYWPDRMGTHRNATTRKPQGVIEGAMSKCSSYRDGSGRRHHKDGGGGSNMDGYKPRLMGEVLSSKSNFSGSISNLGPIPTGHNKTGIGFNKQQNNSYNASRNRNDFNENKSSSKDTLNKPASKIPLSNSSSCPFNSDYITYCFKNSFKLDTYKPVLKNNYFVFMPQGRDYFGCYFDTLDCNTSYIGRTNDQVNTMSDILKLISHFSSNKLLDRDIYIFSDSLSLNNKISHLILSDSRSSSKDFNDLLVLLNETNTRLTFIMFSTLQNDFVKMCTSIEKIKPL